MQKARPWSHSRSSVAQQCGLRFHHKYFARTPKEAVDSSAGRIGIAVHAILEKILKGKNPKQAYVSSVAGLTKKERTEVLSYRDGVHRFTERIQKFFLKKDIRPDQIFPELDISITENGDVTGYWDDDSYWRGSLDLGVLVENGPKGVPSFLIMDHKTGTSKPEKSERYHSQLRDYVAAAFYKYPDVQAFQPVLHWVGADLREDMYDFGDYMPRAQVEAEVLPLFFKKYRHSEGLASQYTDLEEIEPSPGYYCNWCEYAYCCPAKTTD